MSGSHLPPATNAAQFRAQTAGSSLELPYAGLNTFLKGEYRPVDALEEADVGVLGVPYDHKVSNRPGARYGPEAIREASSWWGYLSSFKGGLTNMYTGEVADYDKLTTVDCGDIPVFPADEATTREAIEAHLATVSDQAFPLLLGGDHSCTYPAFCGFAHGAEHDTVGLVQIDAHTDTTGESDLFDSHYHGACTRHIAESTYSDYEHISQVGIRGYERPGFMEFVEETGLNLFTMADVHERGIGPVVRDAVEAAAEDTDAVYVTFDIDSIDPSVAPGTGTPCPDGLTAAQALETMQILGEYDAVGGADLMEVAPSFDPTGRTAQFGAFLLVTLLERRFTV
ncbi:agmatinase family protein [Natrialbaceae archaeon A-chndr2]